MAHSPQTPGVVAGRLSPKDYADGFADMHPPLDAHEALVAADRCYFCHDAPCVTACPTAIDIPMFIRQIQTGKPVDAAKTIFDQNILGGMCARVCPTETLCEEACVRMTAEGNPVEIGRLQRFATDTAMVTAPHPYTRRAATGFHVAVVGAGPAGLACAHRLACHGNDVTIFDVRPKAGGLNEYGIAAYKTVGEFAAAEVDWLLEVGGIRMRSGMALGRDVTLEELREDFDAVFLGMGLAGVNALRAEGEDLAEVRSAVAFIADLRQASDLSQLPVGRDVVIIGGGMTAVDAAVQSKLLGAERVSLVYRRGRDRMGASAYEQDHAAQAGVQIIVNAQPLRVVGEGTAQAVEFAYTEEQGGALVATDRTFTLPADQVFKAIGQTLQDTPDGIALADGKIAVTGAGRTSLDGVWAGGDCAAGGDDLTVTAVAQGRDAAEDIHAMLVGGAEVAAE